LIVYTVQVTINAQSEGVNATNTVQLTQLSATRCHVTGGTQSLPSSVWTCSSSSSWLVCVLDWCCFWLLAGPGAIQMNWQVF